MTPSRIREEQAARLDREWRESERWTGIQRDYGGEDVVRLRGSLPLIPSLAHHGAIRLWDLIHTQPFVPALGASTGMQAVQMVRAGAPAIYVSGWQVAADSNRALETYPDLSLYPSNSVPDLVRRINSALRRADEVDCVDGTNGTHWYAPIVADAEAGFGGPPHAFELTRQLVEAGAAAVHLEDQLTSEKKCGHMGGKVLVPTENHVRTLRAARLAADVLDVPLLLIARTDARGAQLLAADSDPMDTPRLTGERTREGYYKVRPGLEVAIARSLRYAPYADLLWFETSRPDLDEAQQFERAIHRQFPGKLLAYNCSPSFRWAEHLDASEISHFQERLGDMGYKFQFITLAGFHAMNAAVFELAHEYLKQGMTAYVRLQEREIALTRVGYTAVKHQHEVGAGYFDAIQRILGGEDAATVSLDGSTEVDQFEAGPPMATRDGARRGPQRRGWRFPGLTRPLP